MRLWGFSTVKTLVCMTGVYLDVREARDTRAERDARGRVKFHPRASHLAKCLLCRLAKHLGMIRCMKTSIALCCLCI